MLAGRPGHPQAVGASVPAASLPWFSHAAGRPGGCSNRAAVWAERGRDRDSTLPDSLSLRPATLASVYTPPPARPARLCLLGAWGLLQAGMPCLLSPWPCPCHSAWQSGVAPRDRVTGGGGGGGGARSCCPFARTHGLVPVPGTSCCSEAPARLTSREGDRSSPGRGPGISTQTPGPRPQVHLLPVSENADSET